MLFCFSLLYILNYSLRNFVYSGIVLFEMKDNLRFDVFILIKIVLFIVKLLNFIGFCYRGVF